MTVKQRLPGTKDGFPVEAFAMVGDVEEPETWKLPHHKKNIFRALRGKLDIEQTVDWDRMPAAVVALSPRSPLGQRVNAQPEDILEAARHLAEHYRKVDRPLPDTLAAMV